MKSRVKVPATKTWGLVQEHDVYSCPDTPDYDFTKGAKSLLLHSKKLDESKLRVVDTEISLTADRPDLRLVANGLQERLLAYIAHAAAIPGILDEKCTCHRFYFFWPEWLQGYAQPESLETAAALALWQEKDTWFRWPKESKPLQRGWKRDRDGNRLNCYAYDADLIRRLKEKNLEPDGRNNGPAILSFRMAGGERPVSGEEGWPIHHIYDGRGLIPNTEGKILHAVDDEEHFTHSGGLVALHPVAHFLAHNSELLAWLLRWEAFRRFKYDPNKVFSCA
jgi:hypothetical protein